MDVRNDLDLGERLIRLPEVRRRVGLARPVIYKLMKSGVFPARRRVTGTRTVAWRASEIDAYIEGCQSIDRD